MFIHMKYSMPNGHIHAAFPNKPGEWPVSDHGYIIMLISWLIGYGHTVFLGDDTVPLWPGS